MNQVRASSGAPSEHVDEPVANFGPHRAGDLLSAEEGRVADDGIEAPAFEDVREFDGPVQGLPAFVVGLHCGSEASVQDAVQHRPVGRPVAGVRVVDGNPKVVVGLIECPARLSTEPQPGRDDAIGDVAELGGQIAEALELPLLGAGRALGIVVVDLAGEGLS